MNTQVIILAAGHGKRMQSELPKALTSFSGRSFISHVLDSVERSGVCADPIIVVGQKKDQVINALGHNYRYVDQDEQLGTGHAVMVCEGKSKEAENILVLYADHPLVSSETISKLASVHMDTQATITMAISTVPDFNEWRSSFLSFGRLVRDKEGNLSKIVEAKDASEEEQKIKEINPGYMCFEASWLWEHLHVLKNDNIQKEYYLVDLISMAFNEGKKISTISIEPREALGVNTKEQLELIENLK